MNTGVEGDETAIKMIRRWAYREKGVPDNQAVVLFPYKAFWGRTITARTTSDNPLWKKEFGPFCPGFDTYEWNNADDLEKKFKENPNIAGVITEPILGEGGVIFPEPGFQHKVRELCTQYNAIMCIDEI